MTTLINQLDRQLFNCKKYADSYAFRRTYFDQAFGMVTMFCALYPNDYNKVANLWEEVYRPQFEKIMWGE